jgi:UDP-N-acetylmuramate--alanine ligase
MIRSGADVGAGLAAARDARPIRSGERIHVVGASGAGASAAALLALRAGALVSGCDPGGPSPYSAALAAEGIALDWAHRPEHITVAGVPQVDRLAVTKALTAVHPDHPELLAARSIGIPIEPWQQTVADAASTGGQRLVAIAGTHGKSTTSGWLVHVLVAAGRDPSAFVGALLDPGITGGLPSTARWGQGDAFVVEADEYAGNFDAYRPEVAVLLNAEWDHPDVFADHAAVVSAFESWLTVAATSSSRCVVIADVSDRGVADVVGRIARTGIRVVRVALEDVEGRVPAEVIIRGRAGHDGGAGGSAMLDLPDLAGWPGAVTLSLAGRHNAANALAVAAAALELGVAPEAVATGLAGFRGVGRRMEVKGEPQGVTVVDDYAHHPTAIEATLAAVRTRYPGRRLWAVYEPLTYHRTAHMLDRFAEVLATADRAVIADIWAGRDPDTSITSSVALAEAISRRAAAPATAPGSVERTADHLAERVEPDDVVLVMGGGRSYVIAERLVDRLSEDGPEGRARG